ncbi:hypothetical protein Pan110_54630 [Gimesia panareensis]|nr:hypothetical protein Pan110_54630 [Gimesia panareensis]
MAKLIPVSMATLIILLAGHSACQADAESKIETNLKITEPELDNSDVRWEGNFFGLMPHISRRATRFSKKISATEANWLLKNLKHKDRFAICHLMLLSYWGPPAAEGENEHSTSSWYGLRADLLASGEVQYQKVDREKLYKLWSKALSDSKNRFKYGEGFVLDPPFKRTKNKRVK